MKLYRDLWIRDGYLYRTKGESKISNEPTTGFKIIGPSSYEVVLEHPLGGRVAVGIYNFFNCLKQFSCNKDILCGEYVLVEEFGSFQLLSTADEKYQEVLLDLETDEQRTKIKRNEIERNSFYKIKYRSFERELLFVGELFLLSKIHIWPTYPFVNGGRQQVSNERNIATQYKSFVFLDEEHQCVFLMDTFPRNIFSSGKISSHQSSAQLLRFVDEQLKEKNLRLDQYTLTSKGKGGNFLNLSLTKLSEEKIQELCPEATEIKSV